MISWDYFKTVRKLKVDKWLAKLKIASYDDFVKVLTDLGVEAPPRSDVTELFPKPKKKATRKPARKKRTTRKKATTKTPAKKATSKAETKAERDDAKDLGKSTSSNRAKKSTEDDEAK